MSLERWVKRLAGPASLEDRPVMVVALGDSVTMGATRLGVLEPESVYHARLKRMLEHRWPDRVFNVINSGVAGEAAADGLKRMERDVIPYQPDLLLIGFGLNDVMATGMTEARYTADLVALVDAARAGTSADLLLLTPTFMATRPGDGVHAEHRALVDPMTGAQNAGRLAGLAAAVRRVGERAGVGVADVYGAWEALAQAGVDTTALLANGLNHPTGPAHQIAAGVIFACLDPDYRPDPRYGLA